MNIIFKQLLISIVLTVILSGFIYYNNRNKNIKIDNYNYYYKSIAFNFIIINIAVFSGFKLMNEEEIMDTIKGEELVIDNSDPGF